jgi:hypothetical protein
MNLSLDEQAEVLEEVFGSQDGVSYDRIRCNSYHDQSADADISRCEYVIPAKRVVVTPDQLELVFLDNDKEIGNPAYPIYLIAKNLNPLGNGSPLCDRAPLCEAVSGPTNSKHQPIPVPPRYVTPAHPFFNCSFAVHSDGFAQDVGGHCSSTPGDILTCAGCSIASWIQQVF